MKEKNKIKKMKNHSAKFLCRSSRHNNDNFHQAQDIQVILIRSGEEELIVVLTVKKQKKMKKDRLAEFLC